MVARKSAIVASAVLLAGVLMWPFSSSGAAADPKFMEPQAAIPMAKAANGFGVELYAELGAKRGNVFFSPFSVASVLTLAERGGRDVTAAEMAKVLHLPEDGVVNDANKALFTQLQSGAEKKPYQLAVANALWLQAGAPFQADYLTTAKESFGAGAEEMPFATAAEASRGKINDWVAKQTNDKIKDLLPAGGVTAETRMVLTNAVYFKGTWDTPFKKEQTQDGDFTGVDGKKQTGPLMHVKAHYDIAQGWNGADVLALPYKGEELEMMVVLPKKGDAASLAEVEKGITGDTFKTLMSKFEHVEVTVTLPKWKMTQKYDLTQTLQKMGMKQAFSGGANFSGMNGRSDLQISAVVHQAFIDVNEEGTEAAGATGGVMRATAVMREPKPVVFTADHPFVYAIVHRATGTILFMGRLEEAGK